MSLMFLIKDGGLCSFRTKIEKCIEKSINIDNNDDDNGDERIKSCEMRTKWTKL